MLASGAPALGATISPLVTTETETTAAAESPCTPQPSSLTKGSSVLVASLFHPRNSEPYPLSH